MKLEKNASGKLVVKISHQEWLNIGKKAGFMKGAQLTQPAPMSNQTATLTQGTPPGGGMQGPVLYSGQDKAQADRAFEGKTNQLTQQGWKVALKSSGNPNERVIQFENQGQTKTLFWKQDHPGMYMVELK